MIVVLRMTPHDVHVAADGVAGLALIERVRPEVVFADIAMPGLGGLQLVSALTSRAHLAHIPVVMFTALSDPKTRAEAQRLGAAGYVVKGVGWGDLQAEIQKHIGPTPLGEKT